VVGNGSGLGSLAQDNGVTQPFTTNGDCAIGGTAVVYTTASTGAIFVRVGAVVTVVAFGGHCVLGQFVTPCDLVPVALFLPTNPVTENPMVNFVIRGAVAVAAL